MQVLLKELQAGAYSDGLRDQNAVIYLLKTHLEWQDRVMFQDKEICLNCYWHDLIGVTGYGKPSYDRVENVSSLHEWVCTVQSVPFAGAASAAPMPTTSKHDSVRFGLMPRWHASSSPVQLMTLQLRNSSCMLGQLQKITPEQEPRP